VAQRPPYGSSATLVQSSPVTRSWLQGLRDRLPHLEYHESKYWATFKTQPPQRAVAYLNPAQKGVRLFLALDPRDEPDLQPTPSTFSWATRFPSVFRVTGERDLTAARRLILRSHAAIGPSTRAKAIPRPEHFAARELPTGVEHVEGAARQILVNTYERNRRARETCLRHHGRNCAVCGFNFEGTYGETAAGYIQVHHIVPIAQVGTKYRLDSIRDLRPVCPNCHAVIHRREPPFSIEEVRQMLRNNRAKNKRGDRV
jgi:5-methylcytosine-specific restriction endonuclease McrA